MIPFIIGALGLIAYGLSEENNKPKPVKKMAKGGGVGGEQITKVSEAIFSANEKNGKIKISTKASQTLGGLKYLIADLNSEHIASMIFEANEKNGKIKTQMGEKTYGQLLALISHAKANRLDSFNMAQGGGIPMSNEMYNKLDKINNWEIIRKEKHPSKRENVFYTLSKSGNNYKIAIEYNGKMKYPTYFTNKQTAESEFNKMITKYFGKGGGVKVGSKIKYEGKEGKIVSKKGEMYYVQIEDYYPNGDTLRTVLRNEEFDKMAQGGALNTKINALYKKSGFINDDYNWKSKLLEMLQDSSIEAYQIYQTLTAKEKKDILQELFEMENDMGADGDGEISTSKENLTMFLSDSKNGKKY